MPFWSDLTQAPAQQCSSDGEMVFAVLTVKDLAVLEEMLGKLPYEIVNPEWPRFVICRAGSGLPDWVRPSTGPTALTDSLPVPKT